MEIKIKKYIKIDWQKIKLFQPKNFKRLSRDQKNKLKMSLISKGLKTPFVVTELDNELVCLDGHMRIPSLKELKEEGYEIPEKLPAILIECKDKKEAKETVLLLNSRYGDISKEGYNEWIQDIEINDIAPFINIDIKQLPKIKTDDGLEEMELKSFEHHDYLIFYFNNYNDFLAACNKYGVKKVKYTYNEKTKKIGLGRVLDGKRLL